MIAKLTERLGNMVDVNKCFPATIPMAKADDRLMTQFFPVGSKSAAYGLEDTNFALWVMTISDNGLRNDISISFLFLN